MTGTTKIIWPDCLRRSGAICKTIWQPSNKLWPSEIYVWDAQTNPRIPYTCQLTYRMITHHIRNTETLQWTLHKRAVKVAIRITSYHYLINAPQCQTTSVCVCVCPPCEKCAQQAPSSQVHWLSSVILNFPLYTWRAWSQVFAGGKYTVFVACGVNTQWMDILPVQTFV